MAEGCQKPRDYPAGYPGWMHLLVGAIQWQLGGLQRWFGEELEYFSPNVQEPWRDPSLAFPSLAVSRISNPWFVQVEFPHLERGQ